MKRILAVIDLTVKESLRKRVFLALVCFTILVLSVTALLPAQSPEARVKLAESWCLKSVSFFSLMIAVFLSGASLPADVEDRKLFTLLTKPLTRSELLVGKFLGFMAVMLAFLTSMGVVTVAFVRIVAAWSGGSTNPLATYEAMPAREFITVHLAGTEVSKESYAQTTVGEEGKATVATFDYPFKAALWKFGPADWEGWGGPVTGEITLDIQQRESEQGLESDEEHAHGHGHEHGHGEAPVPAGAAPKKQTGLVPLFVSFSEIELIFENVETGVKAARRITLKHRKAAPFTIPAGVLKDARVMQIYVKCTRPLREVKCGHGSCTLLRPRSSFEMSLLASLGLSLAVVTVLVASTVAVSTVVSGPVAIFFGLFLFGVGSAHGFIEQSLKSVEIQVDMIEHGYHGHGEGDDLPVGLLRASSMISKTALTVLPDLGNYDVSEFLIHQRVVPDDKVFPPLRDAAWRSGLMLLLAVALFVLREFR